MLEPLAAASAASPFIPDIRIFEVTVCDLKNAYTLFVPDLRGIFHAFVWRVSRLNVYNRGGET